jgi:ribose/xylose/arabinose/galactoside ABC-type transport system permease subunit
MKNRISSQLFWPTLALGLLLLFNLIKNPGFFAITSRDGHLYGSIIDIVFRASPLILASVGMTLVIATGGVDLSVGAIAALAPAVAVTVLKTHDVFTIALLAAIAISAVVGIWNGILVSMLGLQPIVATLTAMVAGRGIAQLLLDGQIISIQNPTFAQIGHGYFLSVPFDFSFILIVLILLGALTRRTALGLYIEALGSNPSASYAVGLNSAGIKIVVYAASGIFAGLAGLLVSSNILAVDVNNLGQYLELDAILAVVIGGTSLSGGRYTLLGSVLGALIIQTVSTTINTQGIAVESMLIIKAVVVIAVCLLQSQKFRGSFSRKTKPITAEPATQERAVV